MGGYRSINLVPPIDQLVSTKLVCTTG